MYQPSLLAQGIENVKKYLVGEFEAGIDSADARPSRDRLRATAPARSRPRFDGGRATAGVGRLTPAWKGVEIGAEV